MYENDRVIWKCDAAGSPRPTITWRRHNKPLFVQNSLYVKDYYEWKQLKTSNTGWYTCVATNTEAAVYSDFWLGVGHMLLYGFVFDCVHKLYRFYRLANDRLGSF